MSARCAGWSERRLGGAKPGKMRTRRRKRRHPGKTETPRRKRRHPKPGATPGSECGSSARPDSGHVRPSGRGRPAPEGLRTTSEAGNDIPGNRQGLAAVERLHGDQRSDHSPSGRPGVGRPPGKHRSARDVLHNGEALKARGASSRRADSGFRRGCRTRERSPAALLFPDARPFPREGVVFRRFGVLAALLRFCGVSIAVPPFYANGGRLPLPPLMVMRQSRRKKRPPIAPKNPA